MISLIQKVLNPKNGAANTKIQPSLLAGRFGTLMPPGTGQTLQGTLAPPLSLAQQRFVRRKPNSIQTAEISTSYMVKLRHCRETNIQHMSRIYEEVTE